MIEIRENRILINGRANPVRDLNPADFAWVPKTDPIGSVVQDEDGHWIRFTTGKSEHRNHPPVRLPDRQYFVLGDNRDDSRDSRQFGPVCEELLLGKVIATFRNRSTRQIEVPTRSKSPPKGWSRASWSGHRLAIFKGTLVQAAEKTKPFLAA